jgi:hypothetical protein
MRAEILALCGGVLMGLLFMPCALAQSLGVNGSECTILAADCSTIVSITQDRTVNIQVNSQGYHAQCRTTLPSDAVAPSNGRHVKCSFSNSGQSCGISVNQNSMANCTSTTSGSSVQANTEATASIDSSATTSNSVSTQDWEETIRPNGQVYITCQAPRAAP